MLTKIEAGMSSNFISQAANVTYAEGLTQQSVTYDPAARYIDLMNVVTQSEGDSPVLGGFFVLPARSGTLHAELTVNAGSNVVITISIEKRRGSTFNTFTHFTFSDQAVTIDLQQLLVGLDDTEFQVRAVIAGTGVDADIKAYLSVDE
jgi:hypothetical protein